MNSVFHEFMKRDGDPTQNYHFILLINRMLFVCSLYFIAVRAVKSPAPVFYYWHITR